MSTTSETSGPVASDDPNQPIQDTQPLIAKWLPGLHEDLANLFGAGVRDGSLHALGGAVKGFLLYIVPVSVLRRRINGNFRRAFAFGIFVGCVRLFSHVIYKQTRRLTSPGDGSRPPVDEKILRVALFLRKYNLATSGFISALIASLIDGHIYHSSIVLFWMLVRAVRCFLPSIPGGAVIVMCLSAVHILSAWVHSPQDLEPGYKKFLDKQGGKSKETMIKLAGGVTNPCVYMHPGMGCEMHAITYFWSALKRALRLYLPVHLVILLFARRRSLRFFVENLLRSLIFLASYTTLAWYTGCVLFSKILKNKVAVTQKTMWLHVWSPGLATFFERPSRQVELAAYCATYALDSLYRTLIRKGYLVHRPSIALIVMAFCAAIMFHHHKQQPQMLMKWLFKIM